MKRIPTTFSYPVVFPNGVIIYCESWAEAEMYRHQIKEWFGNEENEIKEELTDGNS